MSDVPVSNRLARALGSPSADAYETGPGGVVVHVDDVDRRYRDAIKAGATAEIAPQTVETRREACVREGGTAVRLWAEL